MVNMNQQGGHPNMNMHQGMPGMAGGGGGHGGGNGGMGGNKQNMMMQNPHVPISYAGYMVVCVFDCVRPRTQLT